MPVDGRTGLYSSPHVGLNKAQMSCERDADRHAFQFPSAALRFSESRRSWSHRTSTSVSLRKEQFTWRPLFRSSPLPLLHYLPLGYSQGRFLIFGNCRRWKTCKLERESKRIQQSASAPAHSKPDYLVTQISQSYCGWCGNLKTVETSIAMLTLRRENEALS